MWRRPDASAVEKSEPAEDEVQKFLREAEAKATNLADTPAPVGALANHPHDQPA